jgi:redox-sensitive bicupin YhaK (pirin superfamily)
MGWLDTRHTFSFGDYRDPAHMGFRTLRVINEDWVEPGRGFGMHPHRDMEIITYILSGELEHQDSMGNGSRIRPGEVQRMSAGTGVMHSESNPSPSDRVHLLQIWILPERKGIAPGYEQREFPAAERSRKLRLIAARDGRAGAVTIHQDAAVYATLLAPGTRVEHALAPGRHAWVQVARGRIDLNGIALGPGDGAAVSGEERLQLAGRSGAGPGGGGAEDEAEVLVFDLA